MKAETRRRRIIEILGGLGYWGRRLRRRTREWEATEREFGEVNPSLACTSRFGTSTRPRGS